MKIPEKMKLAMFGNATCRALLISDANKLISASVLKNPKLAIKEVVEFSRNPNLAQNVLRIISDKREWMKEYEIKYNIVVNPKTPGDLSLRWLRFLNAGDLKKIARSKNLPQIVATAARKKLNDIESAKS